MNGENARQELRMMQPTTLRFEGTRHFDSGPDPSGIE